MNKTKIESTKTEYKSTEQEKKQNKYNLDS